jgi:D-alanine transaminase
LSRYAYVNGQYAPHGEAAVHIEDRGYQFADGVYEVCEVRNGALIDEPRHMERLQRSLGELRIPLPMRLASLSVVLREVITRNRVKNGFVYLQVTRGVAPREHGFPSGKTKPSLVVTAKSVDPGKGALLAEKGVAVFTAPDIRWKRPDIKTISLIPNVLARQEAKEKGGYEAWLVDAEGFVTEGAASNAWIVDAEGRIITHIADQAILRGVTRTTLFDAIRAEGLTVEERKFSVKEALAAREAFVTGATSLVMPIISIDGHKIGEGVPGPVARRLRAVFHNFAARSS